MSRKKYKRPNNKKHRRAVLRYLRKHTATAMMVSAATGVPLGAVRWYKRDLERAGNLSEVKHDYCELTGHLAWYLSTKPKFYSKGTTADPLNR